MDGVGRQTDQVDVRPGGERTQDLGICGRGHSGRSRRKGRKLLEERSRIEVVRTRRRRSQGSRERAGEAERERGKDKRVYREQSGNLLPQICTFYCTPDHKIIVNLSFHSIKALFAEFILQKKSYLNL